MIVDEVGDAMRLVLIGHAAYDLLFRLSISIGLTILLPLTLISLLTVRLLSFFVHLEFLNRSILGRCYRGALVKHPFLVKETLGLILSDIGIRPISNA